MSRISMKDRTHLWVYDRIPRWMRDKDFEIFVSLLCFLAGFPLLISNQYSAESIEAVLPSIVVKTWALTLTLCPFLILLGMFLTHHLRYPAQIFWMRLQAVGFTGLAYVGYVYFFAILGSVGRDGWPAAMIILLFSVTCHSRKIGTQVIIYRYRRGLGLNEQL